MYFSLPKYANWILIVFAMAVTLLYVRVRINMYNLSYSINENLKKESQLTENHRQLKIEVASLKSPSRIEFVANKKLHLKLDSGSKTILLKDNDTGKK